ncbi:MAG: terminase small subunit, partial [Oscillospiraceae bacterium]
PAEFPTFQGFANFIGVDVNTLLNWTKEHAEFLGAYMRAKQLQEKVWLVNGMGGLYNSQFAQFFGKNCLGYKDKQETEISGDGFKVVIENATSGD